MVLSSGGKAFTCPILDFKGQLPAFSLPSFLFFSPSFSITSSLSLSRTLPLVSCFHCFSTIGVYRVWRLDWPKKKTKEKKKSSTIFLFKDVLFRCIYATCPPVQYGHVFLGSINHDSIYENLIRVGQFWSSRWSDLALRSIDRRPEKILFFDRSMRSPWKNSHEITESHGSNKTHRNLTWCLPSNVLIIGFLCSWAWRVEWQKEYSSFFSVNGRVKRIRLLFSFI